MADFNKLPADVRGEILSKDLTLLRESQYLSKASKTAAARKFYEKYCMMLPTTKEINNYLESTSNQVIVATRWPTLIMLNHRIRRIDQSGDVYSIEKFSGLKLGETHYRYDLIDYTFDTIDLLAVYNIALLRKSCIRINPNYPSDFVRFYLNTLLEKFDYQDDSKPLPDRIMNLIFLYLYLILNAELLKVNNINADLYRQLFVYPAQPFHRTQRAPDESIHQIVTRPLSDEVEDILLEMEELVDFYLLQIIKLFPTTEELSH